MVVAVELVGLLSGLHLTVVPHQRCAHGWASGHPQCIISPRIGRNCKLWQPCFHLRDKAWGIFIMFIFFISPILVDLDLLPAQIYIVWFRNKTYLNSNKEANLMSFMYVVPQGSHKLQMVRARVYESYLWIIPIAILRPIFFIQHLQHQHSCNGLSIL